MRAPSRRPFLAVILVALLLLACDPAGDTPPPTTSPAAPTPRTSTDPVPPSASAGLPVGQTDTEWGRSWDAVPAGFPTFAGSTIADDASPEPVSARYVVGADPAEVASVLQTALESAAFSTAGLSGPLEDGSFVLDSVGEGECRIETRIVPMAELTVISVRYGAACPPV